MGDVRSISDRLPGDNSTWSFQDMLNHALMEHPDEEVERAILIIHKKGGGGKFYSVRAKYKDMLWMIEMFKMFLLTEE